MKLKKTKAYTRSILKRYGKIVSKGNGVNFYFYHTSGTIYDMVLFEGKFYQYVSGLVDMLRLQSKN